MLSHSSVKKVHRHRKKRQHVQIAKLGHINGISGRVGSKYTFLGIKYNLAKSNSNTNILFFQISIQLSIYNSNKMPFYCNTIQIHCHFLNLIEIWIKYVARVSIIFQVYHNGWSFSNPHSTYNFTLLWHVVFEEDKGLKYALHIYTSDTSKMSKLTLYTFGTLLVHPWYTFGTPLVQFIQQLICRVCINRTCSQMLQLRSMCYRNFIAFVTVVSTGYKGLFDRCRLIGRQVC